MLGVRFLDVKMKKLFINKTIFLFVTTVAFVLFVNPLVIDRAVEKYPSVELKKIVFFREYTQKIPQAKKGNSTIITARYDFLSKDEARYNHNLAYFSN